MDMDELSFVNSWFESRVHEILSKSLTTSFGNVLLSLDELLAFLGPGYQEKLIDSLGPVMWTTSVMLRRELKDTNKTYSGKALREIPLGREHFSEFVENLKRSLVRTLDASTSPFLEGK